jgi:hypothetical protein
MSSDDVQAVVERAVSDAEFAEELRTKAFRAIHGGAGSPEWQEFFSHFATSPDELQALAGAEGLAACTCHSRTVTTTSTPLCTTTTTTTSS